MTNPVSGDDYKNPGHLFSEREEQNRILERQQQQKVYERMGDYGTKKIEEDSSHNQGGSHSSMRRSEMTYQNLSNNK